MRTLLALVLYAALAASAPSDNRDYRGYRLVAATAKDSEQAKLLLSMEARHNVDFLNHVGVKHEARFIVQPAKFQAIIKELGKAGVDYQVLLEDLQESINSEKKQQSAARSMLRAVHENGTVTFSAYMRYREINDYLRNLAAQYPNLVSVESIGKSAKGRDVNVIRISTTGGKAERAVLVDAGIHAREWIAPATALYVIKELVENSSAHSDMLDGLDWYIIPLLNPDGYEYSHTRDRLWRKNRNAVKKQCIGTDLNRNFGFHWDPDVGGSRYPCSLIFAGAHAFSEPESIHFRDFVLNNNSDNRFKMYLTLHSYGSYILYPWGWTSALPEDADELQSIAEDANKAMVAAGASKFSIGSSTNVLYPAAGGSDDWAKGSGNISKSYTIELPMGGRHGFDLPPNMILETVKTIFPGIRTFGERAKALN